MGQRGIYQSLDLAGGRLPPLHTAHVVMFAKPRQARLGLADSKSCLRRGCQLPNDSLQRRKLLGVDEVERLCEVYKVLEACVQVSLRPEGDHHVPMAVIDVGVNPEQALEYRLHCVHKGAWKPLSRALWENLRMEIRFSVSE